MLGKDLGCRRVSEGVRKAHALGHLADDPPVRSRSAGSRQERALAGDTALRIGRRAVLFAPGGRGQLHAGVADRVGLANDIGDDEERAIADRLLHEVRLRHGVDRIGRHDPQRLDATVPDGAEHVDGLQPRPVRDHRRTPEALHEVAMAWVLDFHMGCKRVGETTDFAAAHGVGLSGDRERPHSRLPYSASCQMTVDDRVDFGRAQRRLVDTLAVDGDDLLGVGKQTVESRQRFD